MGGFSNDCIFLMALLRIALDGTKPAKPNQCVEIGQNDVISHMRPCQTMVPACKYICGLYPVHVRCLFHISRIIDFGLIPIGLVRCSIKMG